MLLGDAKSTNFLDTSHYITDLAYTFPDVSTSGDIRYISAAQFISLSNLFTMVTRHQFPKNDMFSSCASRVHWAPRVSRPRLFNSVKNYLKNLNEKDFNLRFALLRNCMFIKIS